jgi:membrane AbrB-like protein
MAAPSKKKQGPWDWRGEFMTLAVGVAGGSFFRFLHVPGGALSGAVTAVAILSMFGKAAPISNPLRICGLVAIGVAIGSVIGPDTIDNFAAYPASVVMSCLSAVLVAVVGAIVWRGLFGWPLPMAVLSSVPGSSTFIISVAMEMGSDAARVAVVQELRVLFLVTILPFFIVWENGAALTLPQLVYDPPLMVALTFAAGLVAALALDKLRMSGAFIIGAMLASGALHFFEIAPGRTPTWFLDGAQFLMGSWVGSRFADFDWRLFGKIFVGVLITLAASMAVALVCALIATSAFHVPFGTAMIGYAPGGQDAMMILALALGVDPIFVSVNHLARYFLVNLSLPFVIGWLKRRTAETQKQEATTP